MDNPSPRTASFLTGGHEAPEIELLRAALHQATAEASAQSKEAQRLAAELAQVRRELAFQTEQATWRGKELEFADRQLLREHIRTERQADELLQVNRGLTDALDELTAQNQEMERRAAELHIANIELAYQNSEKDKRAAELAAANRELDFQNREKELRAAELLEAIAELEAFAFVSSHDLQEPLRKMLLWLDRLADTKERLFNDKEKQHFDQIVRAAHRMRQLIQDLYTYSRVNTVGKEYELVNLEEVLGEVTADLEPVITEKVAVLESGVLCPVYGVRAQFRLLLHHLLDNALKFTRPGVRPHIRISAEETTAAEDPALSTQSSYCRLSVADNGIGFDVSVGERIFQVFQRLHAQDVYPGTGIGLALVHKIAVAHKGIIRARSTVDEGSEFTLYFPMPVGQIDV
ncbi:MAG: two-component sensor histidine kinase [Chitinophagaceae bacterium]|nr:MAG: two-component sensor histidine kinase [Chitinophagaceae bacterium]